MTASLEFIGVARTSWQAGNCPKNMREAKERASSAELHIEPSYRAALAGLDRASHVILLGWLTAPAATG